jgi:hypothetical protein
MGQVPLLNAAEEAGIKSSTFNRSRHSLPAESYGPQNRPCRFDRRNQRSRVRLHFDHITAAAKPGTYAEVEIPFK